MSIKVAFSKFNRRANGEGAMEFAMEERAFRAGIRYEQARGRKAGMTVSKYVIDLHERINRVQNQLGLALEILSATPAGKREADRIRQSTQPDPLTLRTIGGKP